MASSDTLDLGEGQHALQDTLRGFLARQLPPAVLRALLETPAGYSPELHARLAGELRLTGLTIPAEFGGLGMSQAEACVVHTELGRALYPGPLLPSSLAAGVLRTAEDRAAAEQWLPRLADGSVTATVAAADEDGHWSPGPDNVRAERAFGGWRLYGHRWYVVAAHVADIVVVPAVTESGGLAMFLVESKALGYTASGQLGLDLTRRVCVTAFDEAPAVLLSHGDSAATGLNLAERDFLLATAAEAAGGIGWCLDAVIAYAKDREKFGQPGGSFQTLAQACVDMLAQFQDVSAAARHAAATAATGSREAPTVAHAAALRAGEAYRAVTESAIQLFGGIDSTWEHDAQLYYRRAWSAERLAGGPQTHRAAISDTADDLSRTGASTPNPGQAPAPLIPARRQHSQSRPGASTPNPGQAPALPIPARRQHPQSRTGASTLTKAVARPAVPRRVASGPLSAAHGPLVLPRCPVSHTDPASPIRPAWCALTPAGKQHRWSIHVAPAASMLHPCCLSPRLQAHATVVGGRGTPWQRVNSARLSHEYRPYLDQRPGSNDAHFGHADPSSVPTARVQMVVRLVSVPSSTRRPGTS